MPSKFRPGEREALRRWAHFLIERLLDLRFKTDPAAGEAARELKDMKAFETLVNLGRLTAGLGDWAINHEVGLAIAKLSSVPWVAWSGQESPEFLAARAQANDHSHEIAGRQAARAELEAIKEGRHPVPDATLQRRILINLLSSNVGGFPRQTAAALAAALKALSYNEVHPLLQPSKDRLKVGFRELEAQLETIAFLEYRVALGTSKSKAREEIAAAYGVSPATVLTWHRRLKKTDAMQVVRAQAQGRSSGLSDRELRENFVEQVDDADFAFGAEALLDAGNGYKKLKRS